MRAIGYLLLALGFLTAAFVAVRTEANEVTWPWFVPSLAVAIAGVVMARMAMRQATRHEGALTTNVETLRQAITRIVENVQRLDGERDGMHPCDVHGRIDELFPADLTRFVEARESIGHVYGLQAYAEVMNEFAAGERYLNRVWSASVDGYVDEVRVSLARAREQFERTKDVLEGLAARGAG